MSASAAVFSFTQVEFPWQLGPPDGRYLLRPEGDAGGAPTHVVVFTTLGAPERRRLPGGRRQRRSAPEPAPTPVSTGRATIIDVGRPLGDAAQARTWLDTAGEDQLADGLAVLNRTLYVFRLVTADPYLHTVGRHHAIVARVGFGSGEEVADGLWTSARELRQAAGSQRRARVLHPQARLAAVLGARDPVLACEELVLRARMDVDHRRHREAALQLLVALDAAVAELSADPQASVLAQRLTELRGQREAVAVAAQAALSGPLSETERETVTLTLSRIEAALRARSVANA